MTGTYEPRDGAGARLHPTPQFARREWTDLCGEWDFAFDDARTGADRGWSRGFASTRTILVPFPFESVASGIADRSPHPVVWYQRRFDAPSLGSQERLLVHVGACDYSADVFVNGTHVGHHEGGYTPFVFDVTAALVEGDQLLVIRAVDELDDPYQPRGKQDWELEPHAVWYHRTTGIWQPVWLERAPEQRLVELHFTALLARASVALEARLSRVPDPGTRLRARLRCGEEVLAEHEVLVLGLELRVEVGIAALSNALGAGRLIWRPESPTLVDAEVALVSADGTVTDEVSSYFGLRDVAVRDGRFLLNGQPRFLRLALEQGFWPQSHLAAPSASALRSEVELAKQLGFDGVRAHQKIEDPRYLYWCDRLGLLVWEEMPSCTGFSPTSVRRLASEWAEAVARDRSHPCIVVWVPLNESWGVEGLSSAGGPRSLASALYHLTHALDPTRPVVSNDGWEHVESDIWTVHDYAARGRSLSERYQSNASVREVLGERWPGPRRVVLEGASERGQPVMVTEMGGLSVASQEGGGWYGYGDVESPAALAERFSELVSALLDSPGLAGLCYTQLTDTLQERNGLLDEHRVPKAAPELFRAALRRPARSVPPEELDAERSAATSRCGNPAE